MKWLKAFIYKHRLKYARICLDQMLKAKSPELYSNLHWAAEVIAREMCMTWLDNQRLQHCCLCPNTKPLLILDGKFYCQPHFDVAKVKAAGASPGLAVVG